MTRDYEKEKLIVKMSKIRESAVDAVPKMVRLNKKRIITLIITDHYAGTTKEIDVSKLNTDSIMQKMIETYNDIFATELLYIQEKNLVEGPYLSLSLKYNTSVFDVRAKTLGKSKGQ
jgi:hypothetical protein